MDRENYSGNGPTGRVIGARRGAADREDLPKLSLGVLRLRGVKLFAMTVLSLPSAIACNCPAMTLEANLSRTDVVFLARVQPAPQPSGKPPRTTSHGFTVLELFSGKIEFDSLQTTTTACGVSFAPDKDYLVFAKSDGFILDCFGTRAIDASNGIGRKQTLMWLRQLKAQAHGSDAKPDNWVSDYNRQGCFLLGEVSGLGLLSFSARYGTDRNEPSFGMRILPSVAPSHSESSSASLRITVEHDEYLVPPSEAGTGFGRQDLSWPELEQFLDWFASGTYASENLGTAQMVRIYKTKKGASSSSAALSEFRACTAGTIEGR